MTVTSGHGNPKWTREETILALNLYQACEGRCPSATDRRVRALSEELRSLPHHSQAARRTSFRNPAGVALKLQNLRQVATGEGLANVSQIDREVWAEFGSAPNETSRLAALIRSSIHALREVREESPDYLEFAEGRLVTEAHLRRERDSRLRSRLLTRRPELKCDLCGVESKHVQGQYAESIYEAHHVKPLALGERRTKLTDMALVCANCHRLLHRAIALEKRWLDLEEARSLIFGRGS